ncbi:Transcription factor 25 [Actinomortierella ambigua]|nr:Transcription factor 25 [Actinomortierella ambigua]
MSSRALKKLLRDSNGPSPLKGLEDKEHDNHDIEDEEEEDEDDIVTKRPPARNLFALLDGDDQEDDVDEEQDDQEEEEERPQEPVKKSSSKSKKKKNKKKNAAKNANPFDALQEDEGAAEDESAPGQAEKTTAPAPVSASGASKNKKKKKGKAAAPQKSVEEMSVEEFEKSLQQLNTQLGSLPSGGSGSGSAGAGSRLTPLKNLFAIDTRFLDADAEMKKMFGARVVNSEIQNRRYAKMATKRHLLAQPRATWQIRRASGLSMDFIKQLEGEDGVQLFKVMHSERYQQVQLEFMGAVASYDPNNLVLLARNNPFHVDTLLQLSDISKHQGDNAVAGELVEQVLYAFEKCFHSQFNIASGAARLSYLDVENRSFFLALHRHVGFLARRGCWRTAFEFNKLLLGLDPIGDHLGALLAIDFYAIKAHEYDYLLQLYDRMGQEPARGADTKGRRGFGLDRMPNFVYSTAMAQFQVELAKKDGDHTKSSKMLQRAIILFPSVLPLLADKGNFSLDAEMAGESAFYPTKELPKVLNLYVNLFVQRNFSLWKEPEVIEWVKANVKECVQLRFQNAQDPDVQCGKQILEEMEHGEASRVEKNKEKRARDPLISYGPDGELETYNEDGDDDAFDQDDEDDGDDEAGAGGAEEETLLNSQDQSKVSLRLARHVILSDFLQPLAQYLPHRIVHGTIHMHDPVPPRNGHNVYEERYRALQAGGGFGRGGRDSAQGLLDEVIRLFRAAGGIVRGNGGAGGDAAGAAEAQAVAAAAAAGEGEDGGAHELRLQEAQLRQIAEAVQRMRAQHGLDGNVPGAFPGVGDDDEATAPAVTQAENHAGPATEDQGGVPAAAAAENTVAEAAAATNNANQPATIFQALTDMMRMMGLGNGGSNEEVAQAASELLASRPDLYGDEDDDENDEDYVPPEDEDEDEDEDYDDDFEQFGEMDEEGQLWEPYDPAAFE